MENNKERIEDRKAGFYWIKTVGGRWRVGEWGGWAWSIDGEHSIDRPTLIVNENRLAEPTIRNEQLIVPEPVPSPTIQEIKNQMRNDWIEKNPDVKGVLTVSPVPDTEVSSFTDGLEYMYKKDWDGKHPNHRPESLDEQIEKEQCPKCRTLTPQFCHSTSCVMRKVDPTTHDVKEPKKYNLLYVINKFGNAGYVFRENKRWVLSNEDLMGRDEAESILAKLNS